MKKSLNYEQEKNIEDAAYWQQKMLAIVEKIRKQSAKSRSIFEKSRKQSKRYEPFEFAPESILANADLMIMALNEDFIRFFDISETLKNSKDFAKRYFNEVRHSFYFCLPQNLKNDDDLFKIALIESVDTYREIYYNKEAYKKYTTPEASKELLALNPKVYEYFPKTLKSQKDIASMALALDINNIKHMLATTIAKVVTSPDLANKVLKIDRIYLRRIHKKFRDDKDFLLPWISKYPIIFDYVSPRLKADKDFAMHAANNYNFLDQITNELKMDKDLMQKHLIYNTINSEEIDEYQDVIPLLMNVLKINPQSYERLSKRHQSNPDFIYQVLKADTFYKEHKSTNIFCILPQHIQTSIQAEYISNPALPDIRFLSQENKEIELLKYARNKYSQIYLEKKLDKKDTVKKIKI